jgi:integrase
LRRADLAEHFAEKRAALHAPILTVGDVLSRWIESPHDWRPSSWTSARSNARALCADQISTLRVTSLRPMVVRTAMARWRDEGATVSVVSGRFRILRSALGWAVGESLLVSNPLTGMRGPPRPGTRMHVPIDDLRALLETSERLLEKAQASVDGLPRTSRELHRAEQVRLLVRLAADSGARRGELAALTFVDLDGRVLTIERGVSAEKVGPTKTGRVRRLTLGASTANLGRECEGTWRAAAPEDEPFGPWLFSGRAHHQERLTAGAMGHWFAALCGEAGLPGVTPHRLRHTVATFLVGRGELLRAQQRLGHRDASTTLRNYAHALPLEDLEAADGIDATLGCVRSHL